MKITVTKAHATEAIRRDSKHCMIADGIRDRSKNHQFISVDLQTIRFSNMRSGKRYCYLTPKVAQEAIIAFDQGKPVKPFAFTLINPIEVKPVQHVRVGDPEVVKRARRKYNKRGTKSPKTDLTARHREFGIKGLVA